MTPNLPLAGLRILEFTQNIMGPSAGLVLADLGADVVKIEPAPDGESTRRLSGFAAGFFGTFNRNKRSLAVDLKQERGAPWSIASPPAPMSCWKITRPARWSGSAAATMLSRRSIRASSIARSRGS